MSHASPCRPRRDGDGTRARRERVGVVVAARRERAATVLPGLRPVCGWAAPGGRRRRGGWSSRQGPGGGHRHVRRDGADTRQDGLDPHRRRILGDPRPSRHVRRVERAAGRGGRDGRLRRFERNARALRRVRPPGRAGRLAGPGVPRPDAVPSASRRHAPAGAVVARAGRPTCVGRRLGGAAAGGGAGRLDTAAGIAGRGACARARGGSADGRRPLGRVAGAGIAAGVRLGCTPDGRTGSATRHHGAACPGAGGNDPADPVVTGGADARGHAGCGGHAGSGRAGRPIGVARRCGGHRQAHGPRVRGRRRDTGRRPAGCVRGRRGGARRSGGRDTGTDRRQRARGVVRVS